MNRIKILLIICVLLISCAKIRIRPDIYWQETLPNWLMYAGNPGRTNVCANDISLPLKLLWKFNTSSAPGKSMLVINGVVYVISMDGRLYALDIKTGARIGNKNLNSEATCIYNDGCLLIAFRYGDKTLIKYDLKRGRIHWKIDAGDIASEPLILDDTVVVTALYNHIDAYDIKDGTRIWQVKTDDQIRSSPAFSQGILVFGCDDGLVYAIKKSTGNLLWKFKTDASVQAIPAIKDTIVYVGSSDRNFYAIHVHTGQLIWKFSTGGQILQSAAVDEKRVLFGANDSFLYCLDRLSGHKIWAFEAKSIISTPPLICQDKVFFGSLDYHYYALELTTGNEIWKFNAKGRVRTAPIIWGNYLVAASENNSVYAFSVAEE